MDGAASALPVYASDAVFLLGLALVFWSAVAVGWLASAVWYSWAMGPAECSWAMGPAWYTWRMEPAECSWG